MEGFKPSKEVRDKTLKWLYERGKRPLFMAVTGSHLWNLARPESDLDIRGIYADTLDKALALRPGEDCLQEQGCLDADVDFAFWELAKALRMLCNGNGNVVEMLLSPTCFFAGPEIDWEAIARRFLTKKLAAYYKGYFHSQRRRAGQNRGSKALVYTYREIMAGICLMETCRIVYDFHELKGWFEAAHWRLPMVGEFMSDPRPVSDEHMRAFEADWERLLTLLDRVTEGSALPDGYDGYAELNRLLLEQRFWAPKVPVNYP